MNLYDAIKFSEDIDTVKQNITEVKNQIESDESVISQIPLLAVNIALSSADAYKEPGSEKPCGDILANDFMGLLAGICLNGIYGEVLFVGHCVLSYLAIILGGERCFGIKYMEIKREFFICSLLKNIKKTLKEFSMSMAGMVGD